MAEIPDWTDRYDPNIGDAMVQRSQAPEGEHGLPEYLRIHFTEVGPGFCIAELEVTESLLNPFGAAHGGVMAAMIDHMLGSAVVPVVPLGTWPATLEFKVNYLAPTRPGVLRATSRVLSLSKRTAVVSVECENSGRLVGTALGTIALTPPKPPA